MLHVTTEVAQAVVEILAYAESRFAVGAEYTGIPDRSRSPTGEPYSQFTSKDWSETLPQCLEDARARFDAYAADRKGKLYWRIRPEFEQTKKGWHFYMRLLISDKPVIDNG